MMTEQLHRAMAVLEVEKAVHFLIEAQNALFRAAASQKQYTTATDCRDAAEKIAALISSKKGKAGLNALVLSLRNPKQRRKGGRCV